MKLKLNITKENVRGWLLGCCLFLSFPNKINANQEIASLFNDQEVQCLAKNIYFEARGESLRGMRAVAQVTINRVNDYRWPDTICQVVYQRSQFSWTAKKVKITDIKLYKIAEDLAYEVLNNPLKNFPHTHFHAVYVNPGWKYKNKVKIGNHIFYEKR
jgi:spore germination cell wall hydrolase CwlJ-like protein